MSVAIISTFGLDKLLLQQAPLLGDDHRELGNLIGETRTYVVIASLFFGSILAMYAFSTNQSQTMPWYLILLGVIGIALCRTNAEGLKGMGHPNLAILYRQLFAGLGFILLLIAFINVLSANIALVLYVACFLIVGVFAFLGSAFRQFGSAYHRVTFRKTISRYRAGLPLCLASIFASLSTIVPLIILERTLPPEAVSHLTAAYRIFILFQVLSVAAYASDLPALSRAGSSRNASDIKQIYFKMILTSCLIFIVPTLLMILGSDLVMLMFGESFSAAAPVLSIFMCILVVSLVLGPTDDLLLMMSKTQLLAITSALNFITVLICGLYAIPLYGASGTALTIGAGILVQKLLSLAIYFGYRATALSD